MKKFVTIIILFICFWGNSQTTTLTYTPSNAIISNPERGLYKYASVSSNSYELLNQTILTNYRLDSKITLIYREFRLQDFKTSPISESYLNNMQTDFNRIRNAGLKCILRFVYSTNPADSPRDASKDVILGHLAQLQPYFTANSDIIVSLQAGFIGVWGEWYLTSQAEFGGYGYDGTQLTTDNYYNRKAVIDAMLNVLPINRMVQIRTPWFKRKMYGTSAISETQSFNNSSNSRIGHYNDCFLASDSDDGTYINTAIEYPYLEQETKYLPMSGETCRVNTPRSDCATALSEMSMFHWSYLNFDYYPAVIDGFSQENCLTDIRKNLGYRFQLSSAILPQSVALGNFLPITLKIKNLGFAAPFNERNAYIVLKNLSTNQVFPILMNTDPRKWMGPNEIVITENLALPSNLTTGNYKMFLSLPDKAASLSNKAEYAIRMANDFVWDSSTGYNSLNHTVNITNYPLGVIDNYKYNVSLYPIPANNELVVELESIKDFKISMYNALGQIVQLSYDVTGNNNISIPTQNLSNGIYFIEFIKDSHKDIRKIIIQH